MIRAVPVAFACTLAAAMAGLERPSATSEPGAARDRVAQFTSTLAARPLGRDAQTGFLRPLLAALNAPLESQVLVFSRTGVQHVYTGPHTPRALYFDESVVVGYAPGAPAIEIAAHDPVEGLAFIRSIRPRPPLSRSDSEAASPVTNRRAPATCPD